MTEIKYKQIGETIITIIDGNILSKAITNNDPEDFMESLVDKISEHNDCDDDEKALYIKHTIISMIMPPEVKEEADQFLADKNLVAKETDDMAFKDIDKAKRIASISKSFEYDSEGRVFLEGFSIPIPEELALAILDAQFNPDSEYTVKSLVNFWQWAVLNPNPKARIDLFSWFKTGEFVITEQGLIVAYRNVNIKSHGIDPDLEQFVNERYVKAKKGRQAPKNYAILRAENANKNNKFTWKFLKNHPNAESDPNFIGLLSDLYNKTISGESSTTYTDNHTGKMSIKMGEEVTMPREECDSDHNASCSRGLHFMSPKYNLRLGNTTVIILINPYNIVAFPEYDQTKGRCCAYLPIGKAEIKDGEIVELKSGSYDFEYSKYTSDALKRLIDTGNLEELQEKGLISNELNLSDFNIVKSQVADIIKGRVINV